ncbi:MAG TPA: hypothetical protein VHM24_11040 [Gemmatimonadaceae bacterium]|nr:hypothetical protein [Gemmatimonadaceae bacterium]
MTPLIAGTLLALLALSFVLYPLLAPDGTSQVERSDPRLPDNPRRSDAIDALREIEFDRATGKLSDTDYDSLKSAYTQRAVDAMRAAGSIVCARCGPRPEASARFCSKCGKPVEA